MISLSIRLSNLILISSQYCLTSNWPVTGVTHTQILELWKTRLKYNFFLLFIPSSVTCWLNMQIIFSTFSGRFWVHFSFSHGVCSSLTKKLSWKGSDILNWGLLEDTAETKNQGRADETNQTTLWGGSWETRERTF